MLQASVDVHRGTEAAVYTYACTATKGHLPTHTHTHTHTKSQTQCVCVCGRFLWDSGEDEILQQRPHMHTDQTHTHTHTHTNREITEAILSKTKTHVSWQKSSASSSTCQRLDNLTHNMRTHTHKVSIICHLVATHWQIQYIQVIVWTLDVTSHPHTHTHTHVRGQTHAMHSPSDSRQTKRQNWLDGGGTEVKPVTSHP